MYKCLPLAVVLSLLWACDDRQPVETQPSDADIIGRWIGSITLLVARNTWQTYHAEIFFRENHVFEARNLPLFGFGITGNYPEIYTFNGKWEMDEGSYSHYDPFLVRIQSCINGDISGKSFRVVKPRNREGMYLEFSIDPDRMIYFQKVQEGSEGNVTQEAAK